MKKHLVVSVALALSATQLFAFTPHINKGRIEEISVAQACAEMKIPEAELRELNKDFYGVMEDNNDFPASVKVTQDSPIQIFRQTFAETDEVLYRVFSKAIETNDGTPCMFQKGYYANGMSTPNLVFANFYAADFRVYGQSVTRSKLNSNFMPIIKKNKIAGIMIYEIEQYDKLKSLYELEGYTSIVHHKAAVYWKEDFSTANLRKKYENYADIYIKAAKPLIDDKDVFRYTIQNAFDKNPATSYVEDTEDDLMYISFGTKDDLQKIAIINGYAQNNDLYLKNNRVKKIGCNSYNEREIKFEITDYFELQDSLLGYQIFEIKKIQDFSAQPSFYVKEIYKGVKYSDTCIAEVDYFYEKTGWLFGGVE